MSGWARHIPNAISIARMVMGAPVAILLMNGWHAEAFWLFLAAGLSDALDGLLAKRFGWTSRLGAVLDPIADKALLVSAFFVLAAVQVVPLWLTLLVVGRDAVIVTGALAYYGLIGKYEMAPRWLSKLNTVVQIVFVALAMLSISVMPLSGTLLAVLMYTVMVTTLLSGIDYVWVWGRKAWRARNGAADMR